MGLAAEVRDFVSGYQAVTDIKNKKDELDLKKKKTQHDMEYENAILELKRQEMDMAREKLAKGSGGTGAREMTEYQREQIRLAEERLEIERAKAAAAGATKGAADDAAKFNAAIEGVPGGQTGFNPEEYDPSAYDGPTTYFPEDEEQDGYAEGGLVRPKDERDDPMSGALPLAAAPAPSAPAPSAPAPSAPASEPSAIPMTPSATPGQPAGAPPASSPEGAPAEQSSAPEKAKATKIIVSRSRDAAKAAMDSFEREFQAPKAAIGGSEEPGAGEIDFATGEGAMTPEEVEEMRRAVDPNNQIAPHMKSAATMSAAYNYFMERGEQDKAVRAAKGLLVAERRMTQTLGQLGLQAFEDGNVTEACRLINDACNRFPTGHMIEVQPGPDGVITYQVSNEDGPVERGRLNGNEFIELATGVADGQLYMKMMAHFVSDATAGEKKPESFGAALDGVSSSYAQLVEAQTNFQALGSDASYDQRKAAYEAVQQANAALEAAREQAIKVGEGGYSGRGDRGTFEAGIRRSIQSAMRVDENTAIPAAPEEPAPGMGDRLKAWWNGDEDGSKSSLPAPPEDVILEARRALENYVPRALVIERLNAAGYSAEGL